jgi:hypothetical protein
VSSLTSLPFGGGGSTSLKQCGCHLITLECIDFKSQGASILALSAYMYVLCIQSDSFNFVNCNEKMKISFGLPYLTTIFVKQLNTIKFNSILKFVINLSTIYINPMFTDYLIKVVWEFGVERLGFALIKCCWVAKSKRNSFTKLCMKVRK